MPTDLSLSAWVAATLAEMTLAEQIGQMLIADFPAVFTNRAHENWQRLQHLIREQHIGGIILAGGSIFDIALLTNEMQQLAKIPLLVNADLETGVTFWHPWRRARGRAPDLPEELTGGGTLLPRFLALGATRNEEYAFAAGRIAAQECRAIGIHWTNSPLVDINTHPQNPIINIRAFGDAPELVACFSAAYVRGCRSGGVLATLKHFPGHGDTAEDTHMQLPEMPFTLERLRALELVPFQRALAAGAQALMTAHLAFPRIDPSGKPATLSRILLTEVLRQEMGFNGLIMTDALTMQGITNHFDPDEAAVLAAQAGADMLLIPANLARAHTLLCQAVENGTLPPAQVRASVRRILTAKAELGLPLARTVAIEKVRDQVNAPAAQIMAEKMAEDALTLLEHEDGILPLHRDRTARILYIIISNTQDPTAGETLTKMLRARGHEVEILHWQEELAPIILQRLAEAPAYDLTCLGIYLVPGAWKGPMRMPASAPHLLGLLREQQRPILALSFGDPYVLGGLPKMAAKICAYGGGRLMEHAMARALTGQAGMQGKLPVEISAEYPFGAGLDYNP